MYRQPKTPRFLQTLLLITAVSSLAFALWDGFFAFSMQKFLSLSAEGFQKYYFWQPFSYLFVQQTEPGISFSLFFRVFFNSYLLWIFGNPLIHKRGIFHFLMLYFLGGIITGFAIDGILLALHSPVFYSGNMTANYALIIGWLTLYPKANLPLVNAVPLEAKRSILVFFGINLLIDFSIGNWIYAVGYLIAALLAHLYGRIIAVTTEAPIYTRAKIYDFKTGKALLNDDQFLEEMLSKIAIHGKKSLTLRERWRLRKIAKKRKK